MLNINILTWNEGKNIASHRLHTSSAITQLTAIPQPEVKPEHLTAQGFSIGYQMELTTEQKEKLKSMY